MTIMVSLVGEQPIPNLLPVRHLQPEQVILVHTDFTKKTAERLCQLIKNKVTVTLLLVDAYDINQTQSKILEAARPFSPDDILINFTGGTKMMSLAAYQVAFELNAPIFYVQSQKKEKEKTHKTLLYLYALENGSYSLQKTEDIPPLITISDYLEAYLDEHHVSGTATSGGHGQLFEEAVYDALEPAVDEIIAGVKMRNTIDIDFVVRCGNRVGIIETKATLKKPKGGIDQLNTAGGRDYLGIYTQKFFVCDQTWGENLADLKQIATDRKICIIELPSFHQNDALSEEDTHKLQSRIRSALGC